MRSVFSSIGFGRRRVPIESLYQNSDDSTTSIRAKIFTSNTTDHSSMTRELKKNSPAIVQPPPSKNAINFSPNATAALNAFQLTLDLLGKTPIPGIGAVTAVLLQVVKSVQVRMSSRVSHYPTAIRIIFTLRKYRKSKQAGKS